MSDRGGGLTCLDDSSGFESDAQTLFFLIDNAAMLNEAASLNNGDQKLYQECAPPTADEPLFESPQKLK